MYSAVYSAKHSYTSLWVYVYGCMYTCVYAGTYALIHPNSTTSTDGATSEKNSFLVCDVAQEVVTSYDLHQGHKGHCRTLLFRILDNWSAMLNIHSNDHNNNNNRHSHIYRSPLNAIIPRKSHTISPLSSSLSTNLHKPLHPLT